MDIQAKKLDLIRWLTSLNDAAVLSKLYALKDKNQPNDWYEVSSESEKQAIKKGLDDIKNGNVISHTDLKHSVSNKISQLKNK